MINLDDPEDILLDVRSLVESKPYYKIFREGNATHNEIGTLFYNLGLFYGLFEKFYHKKITRSAAESFFVKFSESQVNGNPTIMSAVLDWADYFIQNRHDKKLMDAHYYVLFQCRTSFSEEVHEYSINLNDNNVLKETKEIYKFYQEVFTQLEAIFGGAPQYVLTLDDENAETP